MQTRVKKVISYNVAWITLFLGYYFLNTIFHLSISCPFYKLTHLYCPGCGSTRMLFSLLKLDFKSAFAYNPLLFILLPFACIYYLYSNYIYLFELENKVKKNIPTYIIPIVLVITILFGIARNIPFFSFLAPS